jgi:hypothetical protein
VDDRRLAGTPAARLKSATMPSRRRRLTGLIAIFAILLNTFAPAVSHALAAPRASFEVCSATGLARAPGGQSGAPYATSFEHCPYCAPHGATYAAPPAAATPTPRFAGVRQGALVSHGASPTRFDRRPAQPRAPPLVC